MNMRHSYVNMPKRTGRFVTNTDLYIALPVLDFTKPPKRFKLTDHSKSPNPDQEYFCDSDLETHYQCKRRRKIIYNDS